MTAVHTRAAQMARRNLVDELDDAAFAVGAFQDDDIEDDLRAKLLDRAAEEISHLGDRLEIARRS